MANAIELSDFLAAHTPLIEETEVWHNGLLTLQVIYLAQADEFVPTSLASEYAQHGFRSIAEVETVELSPSERLFLRQGLHRLASNLKQANP